jgi:hypothetical protein
MSELFDAVCETHRAVNGRHYLAFTVEASGDRPAEFELQPSPLEYERLKDHSVDTADGDVGWVPAVYDDGWAVAWDALEGYTR